MSDEPRFQDLIDCTNEGIMPLGKDEGYTKARVCPVCFTTALDFGKSQYGRGTRHHFTYSRCANGCSDKVLTGSLHPSFEGVPSAFVTPIFVPLSKVCGTAEDLVVALRRAHDEIAYLTKERDRLRRQVDASHEAFLRRYAPEQSEQAHEVAEAQAAEAADVYAEVDWSALR